MALGFSQSVTGSTSGTDAEPSGSLTIPAGDNRKLVLSVHAEDVTEQPFSITTMTVGGQSASKTFTVLNESRVQLFIFEWDETTIDAMSGTTVSYTDSTAVDNITWQYFVIEDTDQTATVMVSSQGASVTTLNVDPADASGDLVVFFSSNEDDAGLVNDWDGATEHWSENVDSLYNGGVASLTSAAAASYDIGFAGAAQKHVVAALVFEPLVAAGAAYHRRLMGT